MAYRSGVEGIIIVFKSKYEGLNNIKIDKSSLILVLEKVEKPGNLGAIFRTADAAGVSEVLVCDPACDPYNPNAIRSSLGCIFGVPWAISDSKTVIEWLIKRNIRIISSTPDTETIYTHENLSGLCAIVMGAEDKGLSPIWLTHSDSLVRIPMMGRIDSLNVSVSAAILLFEAQRQRSL
jgi:TrmH family RNA methyltransferase